MDGNTFHSQTGKRFRGFLMHPQQRVWKLKLVDPLFCDYGSSLPSYKQAFGKNQILDYHSQKLQPTGNLKRYCPKCNIILILVGGVIAAASAVLPQLLNTEGSSEPEAGRQKLVFYLLQKLASMPWETGQVGTDDQAASVPNICQATAGLETKTQVLIDHTFP